LSCEIGGGIASVDPALFSFFRWSSFVFFIRVARSHLLAGGLSRCFQEFKTLWSLFEGDEILGKMCTTSLAPCMCIVFALFIVVDLGGAYMKGSEVRVLK
jgi:hypothetical protein